MSCDTLANLVQLNLGKQPLNYYDGSWTSHPVLPQNILVMPRGAAFPPSTKKLSHSRFLLAINLSGDGTIFLDNNEFDFKRETCVLICPHQQHYFSYPVTFSWIFITFELTDNKPLLLLQNSVFSPDEEFFDYLEKTLKYGLLMDHGLFYASEMLTMLVGLLLAWLLRARNACHDKKDKQDESSSEWFLLVQKYILEHLGVSIDYEAMASHFGYSLSHFRVLFQQKSNMSLAAYVRETRLALAFELLLHSDRKISDVAKQVGFDSVFAFSHAFRQRYGNPPRYYRDRHNNLLPKK